MVAVMGASGKSTLLNILGLIDGFDSGSYIFDGQRNIKPNSRQASRFAIRLIISFKTLL